MHLLAIPTSSQNVPDLAVKFVNYVESRSAVAHASKKNCAPSKCSAEQYTWRIANSFDSLSHIAVYYLHRVSTRYWKSI